MYKAYVKFQGTAFLFIVELSLNASVGGRLLSVVPSAKFCHEMPAGSCPEAEWTSTTFRRSVPGAMDMVSGFSRFPVPLLTDTNPTNI